MGHKKLFSDYGTDKEFIRELLSQPLPGEHAQYKMAPDKRLSREDYLELYHEHRNSSVLVLLYPDSNQCTSTILIERTTGGGVHSGQIAFPGGKNEPDDRSFWHTATRESGEEVGIIENDVTMIGELSPLFIPVSKFLVHPFVGILDYEPEFRGNELEVRNLINIKLEDLVSLDTFEAKVKTSYGILSAPAYDMNEYIIWGATAMIISELNEVLRNNT